MSGDDRLIKILENQQVITTPVVRNGKIATLGYQPDAWKEERRLWMGVLSYP